MAGKSDIRAGRAFVELFVNGAKLESGLKKASTQLKEFGASIKEVGTKLAAIGIAAGAGIVAATKRFADFDDQMRAAAAVSQATDTQLKMLTATAMKLGAETSFTAVQVAALMTELGRAGFTASEIDKMTGAVLNLARATGTDATVASGIMAATIRQFGLSAEDSTRVADAFTVAANKSFNTVEQLGEALNYAGPVAHDFNMTLEDTLAIFGGLGNMGIQASNAGTAVRRLLTITGAEAEKLQEIFNVSFVDSAGNARPLIDTLEEVTASTKHLGTAAKSSKFNEAFGLLGITAASALGATSVSVKELKSALDAGAGAAATTAAKMDAGLGGSIRILLSSFEGVAIAIGNALAPSFQELATQVIHIANVVNNWIAKNQAAVIAITSLVAGVTGLGLSLVLLGSSVQVVAFAFAGLSTLVSVVGAAIGVLATPIGLVVVASGLLGAAVYAAAGAFVYASGIVPQLVSALSPLLDAVKAISSALLSGDFRKAWDAAATAIKYVGSLAIDVFKQLPEFAGYAAGKLTRAFVDAFVSVWEWIGNQQTTALTGMLKAAANFAPELLKAMFTGDFTGAAIKIAFEMRDAIQKAAASAGAGFGAGFAGGEAPTLVTSENTKELHAALKAMSGANDQGPSPATLGGAAGFGAGIDPFSGETTTTFGSQQDKVSRPDIPLSDLEEYYRKLMELDVALNDGVITEREYDKALSALKSTFIDVSPIERYHSRVAELKELFDAGIINEQAFAAGQMEALPDKIKAIVDRSKTPLEKFNEQISEVRDFFAAGLITKDQFAAEQERLQAELRSAEKRPAGEDRGRVTSSFSAAALIAQGMGGRGGGGKDLGGKMDMQIKAIDRQTKVLEKIDEKMGKAKLVWA